MYAWSVCAGSNGIIGIQGALNALHTYQSAIRSSIMNKVSLTLAPQANDITGQTFGQLTALIPVSRSSSGDIEWLCECSCGGEHTVTVAHLKSSTKSCGCLVNGNPIHNLYGTPENKAWNGLRNRCYNTSNKLYRYYGGRGIKVCDRWNSFEIFLADMGKKPSSGHSIDRIDNDGDYTPDNCRWATRSEQCNNRSNNRKLTSNGVTLTIAEWSMKTGIKYSTLHSRVTQLGWSDERALTIGVI